MFRGSSQPSPVVNTARKAVSVTLVRHLPARFWYSAPAPHSLQAGLPDSPLRCPAHQEVQQSCIDASGDSQSAEHPAGGSVLPAACLKLFFGTETQVFFQLIQARQYRPQACSKLGSVHVSSLLSLLGGERIALD